MRMRWKFPNLYLIKDLLLLSITYATYLKLLHRFDGKTEDAKEDERFHMGEQMKTFW